jgi:hypothetical protein
MEIYEILRTDFSSENKNEKEWLKVIEKLQQFYKKEVSENSELPETVVADFSNETDIEKLFGVITDLQKLCKNDITKKRIKPDDVNVSSWYNDWFIYEDGTIELKYSSNYLIEGSRLTEMDWISHIRDRDFGDSSTGNKTFEFAYAEAVKQRTKYTNRLTNL